MGHQLPASVRGCACRRGRPHAGGAHGWRAACGRRQRGRGAHPLRRQAHQRAKPGFNGASPPAGGSGGRVPAPGAATSSSGPPGGTAGGAGPWFRAATGLVATPAFRCTGRLALVSADTVASGIAPVRLACVRAEPAFTGAVDACADGVGGLLAALGQSWASGSSRMASRSGYGTSPQAGSASIGPRVGCSGAAAIQMPGAQPHPALSCLPGPSKRGGGREQNSGGALAAEGEGAGVRGAGPAGGWRALFSRPVVPAASMTPTTARAGRRWDDPLPSTCVEPLT